MLHLGGAHVKTIGNHCCTVNNKDLVMNGCGQFVHRAHMTRVTQFYILFLNATHDVTKVVTHDKVCRYNKIMDEVEAKNTGISSIKCIIFYIRTLQSAL